MILPDRTLLIIRNLLRQLPHTDDAHLNRAISEAHALLENFSPDPNKIFELGKYTDFEAALAQETINRQLLFQIGTLDSEIAGFEHIIKRLEQEIGQLKIQLNALSNLKKGERNELLKEKELANLEESNEKLRSENKNLKAQHQKLILELIKVKNNL
jgi:predicted RNase H-like nuclease (RuvC/YqgF family)